MKLDAATATLLGAAAAFLLDVLGTLGAGSPQPRVAAALLLGRLVGVNLLALLSVRFALGRWPRVPGLRGRGRGDARAAATNGAWELAQPGAGRAPLLHQDEAGAAASAEAGGVCVAVGGLEGGGPAAASGGRGGRDDDDAAFARRMDASLSARQESLRKLERGAVVRNVLLVVAYVYASSCSVWTAIEVVGLDVSSTTSAMSAFVQVVTLLLMNLEFVLLKRAVMQSTSGEAVSMPSVHEHPLYWVDFESKGFSRCSTCRLKVGVLTGGYLILQCRDCFTGKTGGQGFQVCMRCYRKHALKKREGGSNGDDDASGAGILRGDKGPKVPLRLTAVQYLRRLTASMRCRTLVYCMLFVICCQCVSTIVPRAQGDCINALVRGKAEKFDQLVTLFAVLVVISALLSCAMSALVQTLTAKLSADMSVRLFRALLSQDIAFYDNAMTGQLNSRLTNDLRQAISPITIVINSFVANVVLLIAGFAVCLHSSWRLTVLAVTVLAPMTHIATEFSNWTAKQQALRFNFVADAQGCGTQALANVRTVRAFGALEAELTAFEAFIKKGMDVALRCAWGQGVATLLSGLVQQGASFVVLYYGGHLALKNQGFEVGSIITFTILWNKLSGAFKGLNENINAPVKAMSAGQRVFEILDLVPDIREDAGEGFPPASQPVEVTLRDVEFAYQSRPDRRVLRSVSFRVEAGKTTAVVGKSGCGKSTISKLLLRFYDPQGGLVLLNGRALTEMHIRQYRTRVGIVSQDTQLFRRSVFDNITYGLDEGSCSQEDVERAATLANADEFIRALPEGYKTLIGEGGHDLSGGQRQRMSIARALVRRPRLLLLDEATSALDAENEAIVQAALDALMREMQGSCTIMVIAHRLSTIRDADHIVVLHEGEVVEQGTHEALVRKPEGRYAAMIARQLTGGGGGGDGGPGAPQEDDDSPSPERQAKQVHDEVVRLIESLPQDKRKEVAMSIMATLRKSVKGGGRGG